MEKIMKKDTLLLFIILLLSTPSFCAMEDSLPEIMQRDMTLRPYVRDLISNSSCEEKSEILNRIESSSSFRQLNFRSLMQGVFGEHGWVPHVQDFKTVELQELFHPYYPKLADSDGHTVFLANVLYEAGNKLYNQNHNPIHLEHAASIGHSGAQRKMFSIDFKLGKMEEAKNYLFCSAAQGNVDALLTLSEVYEGYWSIGVSKDLRTARLLCQEASELGNLEALFNIKVATLTEGMFGYQRNFQQGIREAKELAETGNPRAQEFIEGIMISSADALQEGNDSIAHEDLLFLKSFLGWQDDTYTIFDEEL